MDVTTEEVKVASPSSEDADERIRRAAEEFAAAVVRINAEKSGTYKQEMGFDPWSWMKHAAKDVASAASDLAEQVADVAVVSAETVKRISTDAAEAFVDFGDDAKHEIADVVEDAAKGVVKEVKTIAEGIVELVYNKVHVVNNTNYEVRVAVAPNPDFVIADAVCSVASSVANNAAGSNAGAPTPIKTFKDLKKLYDLLKTKTTTDPALKSVSELLNKTTCKISPREVVDVVVKPLYNPLDYLTASGWGAITGAHEMHLVVYVRDPVQPDVVLHSVAFNTNSDTSWSVCDSGVVRGLVRVAPGADWKPTPSKTWQ